MLKLTPDELIRAAIRRSHEEFLGGKTRPIGEFFAERASGRAPAGFLVH